MTRTFALLAGLLGLFAFNDGGGSGDGAPAGQPAGTPAATPPAPAAEPPAAQVPTPPPAAPGPDVAALQARIAELEAAQLSEQERALQAARQEGSAEAQAELRRERTANAIFRAAAGRLDPDVAAALIRLPDDKVDAAGVPDAQALTAAIDQLLTAKPHLATGPAPALTPAAGGIPPTPNQGVPLPAAEEPGTGTARLRKYFADATSS